MKKIIKLTKIATCFLLLILFTTSIKAEGIMIAAGAGYKKPVSEVSKAFEKSTGIKVTSIFGNIQMAANQARQTGEICCIIGDKKFLARIESTVGFDKYYTIGKGLLVLAYRKGIIMHRPEGMLNDDIKSVFMPKDGKAIYGIAGMETIKSYNYKDKLKNKLTQVATVPQVVSYLLTGEADAGFINMTETLANKIKSEDIL